MSTVAKVFVVLNLILAVAFMAAATTFLGWEDWHKQKMDALELSLTAKIKEKDGNIARLTTQLEDTQSRLATTVGERDKYSGENSTLRAVYDQMKKAYDELNAQALANANAILVATTTLKEIRGQYDVLMTERTKLLEEINRAQEERTAAQKNQAVAELDREKSETQLRSAVARVDELAVKLARAEFALANVVKQTGATVALAQPDQRAKVLTADPALDVYVLSLGSEDGVQVGYRYTISRGSKYIATVQVYEVQNKMAAAHVTMKGSSGPVQVGDDALTATR